MRRLICIFVVHIWHKQVFSRHGSCMYMQKMHSLTIWAVNLADIRDSFDRRIFLGLSCSTGTVPQSSSRGMMWTTGPSPTHAMWMGCNNQLINAQFLYKLNNTTNLFTPDPNKQYSEHTLHGIFFNNTKNLFTPSPNFQAFHVAVKDF